MNTTNDKPANAKPLSEFAAHIKRTMTADELYSLIQVDQPTIPAEVVMANFERISAQGEADRNKRG